MGVKVNTEKAQETIQKSKMDRYKVKQEMFDKQKVSKKKKKGNPNKTNSNGGNNKSVPDTSGETWRPFEYLLKQEKSDN